MKKFIFLFTWMFIGYIPFASGAGDILLEEHYDSHKEQYNILRTAPDDNAPFVNISFPGSPPSPPTPNTIEVLSVHEDWEEVRLHYRYIYNGASNPTIMCARSLYDREFTGFRRIANK